MDIGLRIKKIRESLDLTQEEFGSKIGLVSGTICNIEKGSQGGKKGIGAEILIKIANVYRIDLHWLLTGEIRKKELPIIAAQPCEEYDKKELVPIPIINEVPAGYPAYPDIEDFVHDYAYIPKVPKNTFGLLVSGKSMEPEIADGDIVVIDPGIKELKRGDLGVFRVNNEVSLKRYYPSKNGILLQPSNHNFAPIFITADDECELIGKVIYKIVKC